MWNKPDREDPFFLAAHPLLFSKKVHFLVIFVNIQLYTLCVF
jgi:hypothetical protein